MLKQGSKTAQLAFVRHRNRSAINGIVIVATVLTTLNLFRTTYSFALNPRETSLLLTTDRSFLQALSVYANAVSLFSNTAAPRPVCLVLVRSLRRMGMREQHIYVTSAL